MPSEPLPQFGFRAPPELDGAEGRYKVVVVGGGLVGLTVALDLAQRGIAVVLLDEDDTVSIGSRAICVAKRSLEIYDRLGIGHRMLAKGVTWNRGQVLFHNREIYAFDLLPEDGHEFPAFVNLQQYYAEKWLVEACEQTGLVDLRWKNRVADVQNDADGVRLSVETPAGPYCLTAEWLLACDGARSSVRERLGLDFVGKVFRDRFLIADVVMEADFPPVRRFWFDPPFHEGGSVLLHRQPDHVWRIDFQLGWDADPDRERDPARVRQRVAAMLGPNVPFEIEWVSIYTFRCRRLEQFRHGRILFLGDSAHQVSPFGARGGNGGTQDADNLSWKLASVLCGTAPEALLDTYDAERIPASDENILNSTRSTDFITPKNEAARALRDAVLELAVDLPFARALVNSGRLSRPAMLRDSKLSTPDRDRWEAGLPPGSPGVDAPVTMDGRPDWLLHHIGGEQFTLMMFTAPHALPGGLPDGVNPIFVTPTPVPGALGDFGNLVEQRYDLLPGSAVLFRPDQHVAARWRRPDSLSVRLATDRALCRQGDHALQVVT